MLGIKLLSVKWGCLLDLLGSLIGTVHSCCITRICFCKIENQGFEPYTDSILSNCRSVLCKQERAVKVKLQILMTYVLVYWVKMSF
jgi:hypothetical protein